MQFDIVTNTDQLAVLCESWSRLPVSSPMQSPEWLLTWWEKYADASKELFVVTARQEGELIGIAPWYVKHQRGRRVMRWLGDGRVCSDHATFVVAASHGSRFVDQLAAWLLNVGATEWDEVALDAIDADDMLCQRFVAALVENGCPRVEREQPGSCYVDLPSTYDEYLMAVSKNHRKRCRKWDKSYYQTGRAQVHVATTAEDCLAKWETLVDLHNARRTELGEQGAFQDQQFAAFHQQVIPKLASCDRVQLRVLEVDGDAVAAEYVLQDGHTWYAYQSGMSKTGEELSAGSLSILKLVQDAIAAGCRRLDLLRGTESYKFSWGAVHRPAQTVVLRSPTSVGRLLTLGDSAWLAAKRLRRSLVRAD